ncbi:hypothetical protein LZC95_41405 [Pendulispora brunnea]|uniref:SIS domain-containing protein n=1 Tax=Pendulispora brunnea TaxID=2905690 RepID=A0ABZ2K2E6_9BACT
MNKVLRKSFGLLAGAFILPVVACSDDSDNGGNKPPPDDNNKTLLGFLGVTQSAESVDYVNGKTQFQLHSLLTEQRHEKTYNLSDVLPTDTPAGLAQLFSVDDDISAKLDAYAQNLGPVQTMSDAMYEALKAKMKIFVYGTGATGRLAKEMESTFWRPFWKAVQAANNGAIWTKIKDKVETPQRPIGDSLIGEMTGADRALIASLEGFEDLPLIGKMQLEDHAVNKGDVVIEVTEGGETSAGIGAVLAGHAQWKNDAGYDPAVSAKNVFFVYNNPDDKLLPFDRSRSVIQEAGITKVNLTTGPQAITGSTRMQATTIETFVIAHALQHAIARFLKTDCALDATELAALGFEQELALKDRLLRFKDVLAEVKKAGPTLAKLTDLEADTYRQSHFSTYFANKGIITVFIDGTERAPTFRLAKLDTIVDPKNPGGGVPPRQSWFQVWTSAKDIGAAWKAFLGRDFLGLNQPRYDAAFKAGVTDQYLLAAAMRGLADAGTEQQNYYDFSFSDANIERRGPNKGDLGVVIAVDDESAQVNNPNLDFDKFAYLFQQKEAKLALVTVGTQADTPWRGSQSGAPSVHVQVDDKNDPMHVDQQIALKVLLNAHSTAVMTKLDKVVGNTMTNVSPSNLKLIGRATYLSLLHINDVLHNAHWIQAHGQRADITYQEANAVLYDVMPYVAKKREEKDQAAAEVSIVIVRVLESLRQKKSVSLDDCLNLLKQQGGLNGYLKDVKTR